MRRQKKSGMRKTGPKLSSCPLTDDFLSKTVEIMPDGSRVVSLSPDLVELMDEQRTLFREKFGREPSPGDPIFFDLNADEPREMPPLDPAVMESIAVQAGVRPEIAFAMATTGVFLMAENEHLYSDEAIAEFCAAVDEYRERASHLDS